MASLTDQKLKEMEAEMNRFEQEIEGQGPHPSRFVLGTKTFATVQARLSKVEDVFDDMESSPVPWNADDTSNVSVPNMTPPPPPPAIAGPTRPPALKPPPLPPFMPPQLRHRPPRPPLPNWQGPPRPPPGMRMPPPPGMRMPMPPGIGPMGPWGPIQHGHGSYPGPMQPGYHHDSQDGNKDSSVIIAKPVLTITTEKRQKKEKKKKAKKAKVEVGVATEPQLPPPATFQLTEESEYNLIVQGEDDVAGDMELVEAGVDDDDPTKNKEKKKKKFIRYAAGQKWEDDTLCDWNPDDFRIFCGDLGNEVTDDILTRSFARYPSFTKAKVVRDKKTNKTRGYGFVSFKDPNDFVRAMREMNGKYVGNRPIKLRKSSWKDRNMEIVRKKEREMKRLGLR